MTEQMQPYNLDAERAVLGSLLMENSAVSIVLPILNADGRDFYHTAHCLIFKTVLNLIDRGSVADLVTVIDELRNQGKLEKVGGVTFVAEVVDGAITAANIRYYAEIVKSHAIRRNIITEASNIIEAAYDPTSDIPEVIEKAQSSIYSLSIQKEKDTTHSAYDLAKQTLLKIEEKHKQGDLITGIASGFTDLDNLILGLNAGDLIIIAGRPGMGKSALAGNISRYVSGQGNPVAYFSLEMPADSLMTRLFGTYRN